MKIFRPKVFLFSVFLNSLVLWIFLEESFTSKSFTSIINRIDALEKAGNVINPINPYYLSLPYHFSFGDANEVLFYREEVSLLNEIWELEKSLIRLEKAFEGNYKQENEKKIKVKNIFSFWAEESIIKFAKGEKSLEQISSLLRNFRYFFVIDYSKKLKIIAYTVESLFFTWFIFFAYFSACLCIGLMKGIIADFKKTRDFFIQVKKTEEQKEKIEEYESELSLRDSQNNNLRLEIKDLKEKNEELRNKKISKSESSNVSI